MAERAIRTIKQKVEKYFHVSGKRRWIDVIDKIVSNYNQTPHSAHGYPPVDVASRPHSEIYKILYPHRKIKVQCKLKRGDLVRILREKRLFEKGYTPNWSTEVYKIKNIRQSNAVCWYKLSKINGEELAGIWYYYQLNFVSRNADSS